VGLRGPTAQLVVGLTLGRRFCLQCLAYFELVQPRFGEGLLEDARPPRFAILVGAIFLSAATASYVAGLDLAGAILGAIVAAGAARRSYRLLHRLRGLQARFASGRAAVRLVPATAATDATLDRLEV